MKSTPLPVLPLKNSVLFPGMTLSVRLGRPSSLAALEAAMSKDDKVLLTCAQTNWTSGEPDADQLFDVGTRAVIRKVGRTATGAEVTLQGLERMRLLGKARRESLILAKARRFPLVHNSQPDSDTVLKQLFEAAKTLDQLDNQASSQILHNIDSISGKINQVYFLISSAALGIEKEQQLLEAPSANEALRIAHSLLTELAQKRVLQREIAERSHTALNREDRERYLRQHLRQIQLELGEGDASRQELDSLQDRLAGIELPGSAKSEVQRELFRLQGLPRLSTDYELSRAYLETVLELPWQMYTTDKLDLTESRRILDEVHYDLNEIKERILDELALLKLRSDARAPVLCLVGPPGSGKTSLGASIAKALGRHLEHINLGGINDEAELRGHRRTFVGATPGRLIQAIRRARVNNPVIVLDEIDKMGADTRGDPYSVLIEILDSGHDGLFRDIYLNFAFDISKVLFIATANSIDSLPSTLIDRLEVLYLSGYSEKQKLEIANRFLLPKKLSQAGLDPSQLHIAQQTLLKIIRCYTREAGVRQLERCMAQIIRKAARHLLDSEHKAFAVTDENLTTVLGPERVFPEKSREHVPPGVAIGLVWTETGGDIIFIESTFLPEGKSLVLTGQLGKVMRESAEAALSYVWSHATRLGIETTRFQSGIHIHIPAGAIPKDGPSAGITMAAAITSLLTQLTPLSDVAMTGEITLSGLLLPVGGIKEKILAAHRSGIKKIILPKQNEGDLIKLPEEIRESLQFVPVETIDDALAFAVPGIEARLSAAKSPQ